MPRRCVCAICNTHRDRGSMLYTTDRPMQEMSPMRQRLEVRMHRRLGICPHLGLPDRIGMVRYCLCDVCHMHRTSGSPLYSTLSFADLNPLQQKIQLERHLARGVCPHHGPPFTQADLTAAQLDKFRALWD